MSPIVDPKDKKSYQQDSRHEILPPFVSGSYFTVSRDVVSLLTFPGPRLFTKHEDQDIGVWLYSYGIKPIHDRRIQEWDVCENDLIAKRFGDGFKPRESMRPMYHNVIERKPLCTGYRQEMCAPCYPCTGRTGHWKENGLYCDSVRGITLRKDNTDLETSLSFDIKDKLPSITSSQEWIIPGLLSETSSIFSDSEDWVRLHWTHWDKDQSAWQQRNTHALESLFIHSPDAVVVFISNTLSPSFFSHFTQQGYQIHIISYSKDSLLRHHWFVDSGTEEWLRRWDEWSQKGKYFSNHLKDYIRMIVMYKYGGLYMDLNAFWLRAPGDRIAEFIGSDISDNDDDLAWSLDEKNTFLTTHVMRFQRGRSMFKSIAVSAFTPSTYDPDCHSCGSTKGFTSYAKPRRISLEKNGVRILPREALYPYTEKEGAAILEMTGKAIEDVLRLEEKSLCLYLHDGASSHKPAAAGSILSEASRIWSLDLLSRTHPQGSWIQGPKTFYIRVPAAQSQPRSQDTLLGKEPGLFRGVDSIFVRGDGELVGQPVFKQANILLSVEEGLISMDSTAAGSKKIEMDLGSSVNLAQINLALSKMKYIPPTSRTWTGADRAHVRVEFGSMRQELDIPILRRTI
ncbi:hypothetical protein BGW38_002503 [Lunasporangiospora selenospora]|uniref:Alpha 1,4-glycosyltransferase domain-containing protein n=1 Tax=Lunasporangiospora selenospora TaxID=979761 RepID=A0A9P6FSR7_9FUNG|nr:hypothetical protein BGW38_002503 [Lunasporangiospora selenospora]